MEQPSLGKLLLSYLKVHMKTLLSFGIFCGIFTMIFFLRKLPLEPILYAALLCLATACLLFLVGFGQYYRRHTLLRQMANRIEITLSGLPEPKDCLEQDYQKLLQLLARHKREIVSRADNRHSEMVEYYTLWAHQIKTPIAAMGLLLQAEENRQNATLTMELFKIEQYVDMVLQYLRLQSESSDLLLQQSALDDMVKQAVRKYATLFILKKVRLNLQALNCLVLTDEKWLVFVLEQLLSNALKYTPQGVVSIYMAPGKEKTLVIQDTGIGIQEEDLPRIFEKGFTGYNGRMDKKSTGIGLYLCNRILQKLGHTITITSQVGAGTKVEIGLASTKNIVIE